MSTLTRILLNVILVVIPTAHLQAASLGTQPAVEKSICVRVLAQLEGMDLDDQLKALRTFDRDNAEILGVATKSHQSLHSVIRELLETNPASPDFYPRIKELGHQAIGFDFGGANLSSRSEILQGLDEHLLLLAAANSGYFPSAELVDIFLPPLTYQLKLEPLRTYVIQRALQTPRTNEADLEPGEKAPDDWIDVFRQRIVSSDEIKFSPNETRMIQEALESPNLDQVRNAKAMWEELAMRELLSAKELASLVKLADQLGHYDLFDLAARAAIEFPDTYSIVVKDAFRDFYKNPTHPHHDQIETFLLEVGESSVVDVVLDRAKASGDPEMLRSAIRSASKLKTLGVETAEDVVITFLRLAQTTPVPDPNHFDAVSWSNPRWKIVFPSQWREHLEPFYVESLSKNHAIAPMVLSFAQLMRHAELSRLSLEKAMQSADLKLQRQTLARVEKTSLTPQNRELAVDLYLSYFAATSKNNAEKITLLGQFLQKWDGYDLTAKQLESLRLTVDEVTEGDRNALLGTYYKRFKER